MNSKISKIGAVVLTAILFGTAFFVPVSSVKVEQTINGEDKNANIVDYDDELNSEAYMLDRHYDVETEFPSNMNGDNDDAGHKNDATHKNQKGQAKSKYVNATKQLPDFSKVFPAHP